MILEFVGFQISLNRIRSFLDSKAEDSLTTDEKVFGYIAAVSSTYSALENFAEELAFTFSKLSLGPPRVTTDESVARIRRQYVQNSATLLTRSLGTGRYEDVTELAVAESLASCLDDSERFELIADVLAYHSANLRLRTLLDLYTWGASTLGQDLGRSDALQAWAAAAGVASQKIYVEIERELEDLVERRNAIAHRAIPDDILSFEQIRSKVDLVEALGTALVTGLADVYLRSAHSVGKLAQLGQADETYQGGSIVVISELISQVSVGDAVAAISVAAPARWGRVLELRIDETPVTTAAAGSEVGIRLDFECRPKAGLHTMLNAVDVLLPLPLRLFGDHGPLTA